MLLFSYLADWFQYRVPYKDINFMNPRYYSFIFTNVITITSQMLL